MQEEGLLLSLCHQIADWIYPHPCERCGERTLSRYCLCESCLSLLETLPRPLCPHCGGPVSGSVATIEHCENCGNGEQGQGKGQGGYHFDFARAPFANVGKVRELILAFKYGGALHLAKTLAWLMSDMWEQYPDCLNGRDWCLVPIPMHHKKRAKRGYNQADELASALGKLLKLPVIHALTRNSDLVSQASLDRKERLKHVRLLYGMNQSCQRRGALSGKNVLLIDDILTTGSTADACARILKKEAKVQTVGVLTVARTIPWAFRSEVAKNEMSLDYEKSEID
ncbi:MAG: ComF family protein [Akkermansia sp.]